MKTEALKAIPQRNNETEDAEKDYMDEEDIYNLSCRMSVVVGALAAINDGLLNKTDAEYALLGCEHLSRDLISHLRDMYEEMTK